MRVAGKGKLVLFKVAYTDARSQIDAWLAEAEEAQWRAPQDIKQRYAHASFLRDNRVIFNIRGNNYRLDTKIDYQNQVVLIVRVGTHEEYDNWTF